MTDLTYDPSVASFRANPYPTYARFRSEAPIVQSATGLRVVSRHGDVAKILRSPDVARDIDEAATDFSPAELEWRAVRRANRSAKSMLNLDAPDHTRLRGLVSKAFTPKAIGRLRPRVQSLVDSAFDDAVAVFLASSQVSFNQLQLQSQLLCFQFLQLLTHIEGVFDVFAKCCFVGLLRGGIRSFRSDGSQCVQFPLNRLYLLLKVCHNCILRCGIDVICGSAR